MTVANFEAFMIQGGALDGEVVPLHKAHQKTLRAGGTLCIPYRRATLDFVNYQVVAKGKPFTLDRPKDADRCAILILCSEGHLHLQETFEL